MPFKVTRSPILVPIESPLRNFLLVTNTNLHPISHRFQIIADYWSNLRFRQGYFSSTHPFVVNPMLRTTKFRLKKFDTSPYRSLMKDSVYEAKAKTFSQGQARPRTKNFKAKPRPHN